MSEFSEYAILNQYHDIIGRKMSIDLLCRCSRILTTLIGYWGKKNKPVPWTVLKYEVIGSDEFKVLRKPDRTFSNNLRLLIKLDLIVKINGAGYELSTYLKNEWRKDQ